MGALEEYSFEHSQHDLPCISSWSQNNFKSIAVTVLCQIYIASSVISSTIWTCNHW